MKHFTSKTQKTGEFGEEICTRFLVKQGFKIIERNYTIPQGEIDIIAKNKGILHFIEVKSVSCENIDPVSYETIYNPAENVTREKIKKCQKTIQSYLSKNHVSYETWQFDVYVVYIDRKNIKHGIKRIENVI